jgi:bifunctional ADP-heptose synthase (sugar kinase/adenylyltransferase)
MLNILVIGDSCLDVFVKGRVDRLCPEAPVPVINPVEVEDNWGMAGNVLKNVQSLAPEAKTQFITQKNRMTKTRYVDKTSGYILLRVDENDNTTEPLTKQELDSRFIRNGIHPKYFDFVLISDYNKGFLTEENMEDIIEYFNIHGVKVFLDTKKILGEWSRGVDFVKINEKEYKENCKYSADLNTCRNLIVTLGASGSLCVNNKIHAPSEKREVMDVSGAGDTYFAAFAIKYKQTGDILQAMTYANKASAVAVSKHGVVAVKQSEVV